MHQNIRKETARRRTFAIISHPDAGKTTLTEKLLLYGGAKDLAGGVRHRKNAQATSSDWLELEKQRGISVSSTVLQFDYEGFRINLLDTPGHRDFSEDTYRVLTAVDSALMVLDAAKGIEEQTLKLFEVCKSRSIPIITFINKCDRPGKDPLELLDEIESRLGLKTFAANLPIGEGPDFKGIFERVSNRLHLFQRVSGGRYKAPVKISGLEDPALQDRLPDSLHDQLAETNELLAAAGNELDRSAIAKGALTPVYFGSAINNFGVQLLLDGFLDYSNPPQPRKAGNIHIHPEHPSFSAFVFKIQANMDPHHRDRLVFMRVCSGKFHRDLPIRHAQSGRELRLTFSHQIFGREREIQEEAWPGDILGITGKSGLEIGDTLAEELGLSFDPIPRFAPEAFIRLRQTNTSDFKRFRKGLDQLLQEKVVQQFFPVSSESRVPLLGAVGPLQFDVVCYRLKSEYGAETESEQAPWTVTRWADPSFEEDELMRCKNHGTALVRDEHGNLCLLFESEWSHQYFHRQHPEISLHSMPVAAAPV